MKTRGFTRRSLQAGLLALTFNLIAVAAANAQSHKDFGNIKIKNFGQLDESFYRGAQPDEGDYAGLSALGIKTIIDLRDDPSKYEKRAAEAAGMRYVNIAMSDSKEPSEAQIEQFLKLANDPATGPFFVHCLGGRHRTGVVAAVYRMTHDGWDFDRAYKEMKDYDFYTRWGHGSLKDYTKHYYDRLQSIEVSSGQSGVNR
ncbi:MAG: tyrosine-protein phosphatase [Blastocatellia bacterium]